MEREILAAVARADLGVSLGLRALRFCAPAVAGIALAAYVRRRMLARRGDPDE